MSIFANGDFQIKNSWGERCASKKSSHSRPGSTHSNKRVDSALANAGRHITDIPDALDEEIARKVVKQFYAELPPMPPSASCRSEKKIGSREGSRGKLPPRQKASNPSEDLLTSMASRLAQVEKTCSSQKSELKEKEEVIRKLKGENTFLKGMRENSEEAYKKFETLQHANQELETKVKEMEDYLKKYGLKWVGHNRGQLDHARIKKDIANSRNNYRLPSEIDLGVIQRRVEELNGGLHAEGQGTEIYADHGVHKFRKTDPLPLAFYGDGIAIKGLNFYPYKSKESLKILSDLVDGYFPYVLKGKYPNGVLLKVVDMIAIKYSEQQNSKGPTSMHSLQHNQFKAPSKQQFLNKLPKQVIKNGKVIPIRQAIENKLNGEEPVQHMKPQSNDIIEQIDGCSVFVTPVHKQIQNQQISQDEVCVLKIRTQEGKICIIELHTTSVIEEVYSWMSKVVQANFVLMSNYPKRSYLRTEQQNLEQLGLFPNAILHIQLLE